jgi:protein SCO1/2
MRNIKFVLWALVLIAGVGATIWSLLPREQGFGQTSFNLVDHNGDPITEAAFRGQPSGLFFGFTHCPDVCPTTLSEIAVWLYDLGEEGKNLKFFFVSVDPERDDPETLKGFVTLFSDQITGITGDPEEIKKLEDAWGIFTEKVPTSDGSYTMNHTASLFLLNRDGRFEGTIAYGEDMDVAMGKLRNLIAKN